MSDAASEQNREQIAAQSVSQPNTLITGGQVGSTPQNGAIAPVAINNQAITQTPLIAPTSNPNVLTADDANAYTKTAISNLSSANDSLAAREADLQSQQQAATNSYLTGAQRTFEMNKEKIKEQLDPQKENLASNQRSESLTQKVANVKTGVAGTDYGRNVMGDLTQRHVQEQQTFARKERDLISQAWDSALSGSVAGLVALENARGKLTQERQQAEANYYKDQKDMQEIESKAIELEQKGEGRVGDVVKRAIETGFEPSEAQLGYLDSRYNLPTGTSRTILEASKIDIERTQAKDQEEARVKAIDGATKLFSLLEKVPTGQSVSINGVEYVGQSRGDIKTGTETDNDGNVTFWEYNQNDRSYRTTSMGNIGKAADGWTVKESDQGTLVRVNARTGQMLPFGPTEAQREWQEVLPEGSVSPFTDEAGQPRTQCGAFVNDICGAGVGDTFESKMTKIDKTIKPDSDNPPQVGDFFVQKLNTWTGHTGIVAGVETLPNGKTIITALESNYPQAGKVTSTRQIDASQINGFGRTGVLHPLLQTGPDSKRTQSDGVTGGTPGGLTFGLKTTKAEQEKPLSATEIKNYGLDPTDPKNVGLTLGEVKNRLQEEKTFDQAETSLLKVPSFEDFSIQRRQEALNDPNAVQAPSESDLKAQYEERKGYVKSVQNSLNAIKRGKFESLAQRAEFLQQADEAVKNGDIDGLENVMNQVALKSMSVDQQNKFQSSKNLAESYDVSKDLLASFTQDSNFRTGSIKAVIERAKKKGAFDADPRYTQIEQLLASFQNEYRNALFGASLTPGELAEANKVIVDIESVTPKTMWDKLDQGAKIQNFAADVRLADALGMPRPKLKDYLK